MSDKSLDDFFVDWENTVFGYGYGTGEQHTIPLLKQFLELCRDGEFGHGYNYQQIEVAMAAVPTWLMINILCHADILEYGTSPRYGWLTPKGKRLKEFVSGKTAEELYQLTNRDHNYVHCYPDACNCGPHGYEKERICQNPFWLEIKRSEPPK